jgi:hypothetical protein
VLLELRPRPLPVPHYFHVHQSARLIFLNSLPLPEVLLGVFLDFPVVSYFLKQQGSKR